jgi:hypothetical protein
MSKPQSSRKQIKTLARNLADRGSNDKIRMRALEILFVLDQQGKKLPAKSLQITNETAELEDLLGPAGTAADPGETSGD